MKNNKDNFAEYRCFKVHVCLSCVVYSVCLLPGSPVSQIPVSEIIIPVIASVIRICPCPFTVITYPPAVQCLACPVSLDKLKGLLCFNKFQVGIRGRIDIGMQQLGLLPVCMFYIFEARIRIDSQYFTISTVHLVLYTI